MAAHLRTKALIIFILSSSFYLYEFVLQVAPSIMMKEIMESFQVGAVGFGMISSFYFYAYAPMQLPAGILFDKYGPRLLMTLALLGCAIGCFFFAVTTSSFMASFSRFLIGFASAFSFIGILILVARWFKPSEFALYVGIAQLLSSVGAIFGESPLAWLFELIGWRPAMVLLGVIGVILAALVGYFVEDSPTPLPAQNKRSGSAWDSMKEEGRRLLLVCKNAQTWWVGLYSFCSWTPIAVFAALWVVPYLQRLYGVSVIEAGHASMMIWVGIGIGSPWLGWFSEKIGNRRYPLMLAMAMGLVACTVMMYSTDISWPMMYLLLLIIGLAASGQTLSFAVVKENNSPQNVGTASGFNNFAVVIGGALLQPVFGYILNMYWDGTHDALGTPIYSATAYQAALWILQACYLIGILTVAMFIKETFVSARNAEVVAQS